MSVKADPLLLQLDGAPKAFMVFLDVMASQQAAHSKF
jgi:hypothetical protein